ncbi:MAG: acyl-CoA reductase, partial [Sediminibacterium sp.]
DGSETKEELSLLADDIQRYFGLGCRNITQLYVPESYDFVPVLHELKRYEYLMDYHKYKHNYDYHLALLIMGNKYYMNNDSLVLTENISPFSPVSQVHYQFYKDKEALTKMLSENQDIQCVVGHGFIPIGQAQSPGLTDYADGVDTMAFLQYL